MRRLLCVILVLAFLVACAQTQELQPVKREIITPEPEEKLDVIEKLVIPCPGRAGTSFYLLTGPNSFDIIKTAKVRCGKEVEVLERVCSMPEFDGTTTEMDKIRQGNLVGWAQRRDLTCPDMYCYGAPDTICDY